MEKPGLFFLTKTARKADVVGGVVVIVWGLVWMAASLNYGIGLVGNRVEAGLFPFAVGVCLVGLGVTVAANSALGSVEPAAHQDAGGSSDRPADSSRRPRIASVLLIAAFFPALSIVGFELATFMFLLLSVRALGQQSWGRGLLYAVSVTAVVSVLFRSLLDIELP